MRVRASLGAFSSSALCSFFEIWQKGTKPESLFFLADLPA